MEEPVRALKNRVNLVRLVVIWFTWKSSPIKQGAIIPEIAGFSSSELKVRGDKLGKSSIRKSPNESGFSTFLGSLFQQVRK